MIRTLNFVGPLGLEPRLFWTKTRRVASYTMGQFQLIECANLEQSLTCTNILSTNNVEKLKVILKYQICFTGFII